MIINPQKHIFTAQRLDFPSNAWQMPQGGIENGETLEEAAFRELNEETSLTAINVKILTLSKNWIKYDLPDNLVPLLWDGKFRGQKQKWFLLEFTGDDEEININTQNPEFSDWRWSNKGDLLEYIVPFKLKTYEQIVKEFSGFL
jgi:putative (di)nucleoside polyphosphate hydrolase